LVRSYSARALGKQKNEKAIPDLIERLKIDDFFGVRAEAAEALVIICSNSQSTECKKARKELEDAKVRKGQRRINAGIEEDRNKRVVNEAIEAIEKIEESVKTIDRHVQKGINAERDNVEDAKRREDNCQKAHPSYES